MTDPRKKQIDAIRKAIVSGTKAFLAAMAKDWRGETIYGVLLEAAVEGDNVYAVAGTEEGLTRIAEKYAAMGYQAKSGDTLTLLRKELRWGSPEDGWYSRYDAPFFDRANKLLSKARDGGLVKMFDGTLNRVCLAALRELNKGRAFGEPRARKRPIIGICYVGGDNSEKEFLGWAERVNPPSAISRLRIEMAEGYAASKEITRPNFSKRPNQA
jgi:hypothetical protein